MGVGDISVDPSVAVDVSVDVSVEVGVGLVVSVAPPPAEACGQLLSSGKSVS